MGPIKDTIGVEQDGTDNSDQYKCYNNEKFYTASSPTLVLILALSLSFV